MVIRVNSSGFKRQEILVIFINTDTSSTSHVYTNDFTVIHKNKNLITNLQNNIYLCIQKTYE